MNRTLLIAGLALVVAACAGDGSDAEPPSTVLVSDAAGRPFDPQLSPDGTRLAYVVPVDGQAAVFVANADGGNPVRLTHGVWDSDPQWSPDGQWIAYQAEAPAYDIFVVPSAGGEPRQLTSGPAFDDPTGWLADGSAVVFYRFGAGDIRTMAVPLDGGDPQPLVDPMEGNQFVAISPDGTKAAFDLHRGGHGTVWVQDLAGGAPRQLTTEGLENTSTARMWSPDSRSVLFTSRRTGTTDLWVADVETGALRQLTNDVRNDFAGQWSPDGRWVMVVSDRGGQNDLWIVPAAGGEARRVTHSRAFENNPHWSPDGRSIVFTRFRALSQLHVIPADGGASRVLVEWDDYEKGDIAVSPDGSTVLFASNRSGNSDIWAVPFAGGEPTPFATSPLDDRMPRWSPDGSQVVFTSTRGGSADLWVAAAMGGEARRLTDWPSAEDSAQWSPDGQTIAFLSDRDASVSQVWIMPAMGGEATRVSSADAPAFGMEWSPDGRSLYYVGVTPSGERELYRVVVAGGTPVALGADPNIYLTSGAPDGSHVAYSTLTAGWGFIEVIPATGGTPRRLTTRTERVYQPHLAWSPAGGRIAVVDYDYAGDTDDLQLVTWPAGTWQALTSTPDVTEGFPVWTPDGSHLVYVQRKMEAAIVSVSVEMLVGSGE